MTKKLVRFDWAMKKMLRHKANFDILEGFLSELLNDEVKIKQVLESESNKETEDDKFNRVDILVENQKGELIIIEVQSTQEHDYFHRIKLDEWVYFLKNAEIKNTFTAKGLKEANEKLDEMKLSEKDRKAYNGYLNHLHSIASRNHTIEIDTKEIIEKTKKETRETTRIETRKETQIESVIGFYENGVQIPIIAKSLKIEEDKVEQIIEKHKKRW